MRPFYKTAWRYITLLNWVAGDPDGVRRLADLIMAELLVATCVTFVLGVICGIWLTLVIQ